MNKSIATILIILTAAMLMTTNVFASEAIPAGTCPTRFEIHQFMHHMESPMHRHIGLHQDINQDGYICVKVVSSEFHVHVDNWLR